MDVDYVRVWQDDPVGGITVTTPVNTDSTASAALVQEALDLTNKDLNDLLGEVSKSTNSDGTSNKRSTFITDVQKESQLDPITIIAKKIIDEKQFLVNFIVARITAIRGYFDEIFANKIHTKEVCLGKSDGTEVCVNGDDLNKLLPSSTPTPAPITTEEPVSVATQVPTDTPTITPIETSTPTPSPTDSPVASPIETAIPSL